MVELVSAVGRVNNKQDTGLVGKRGMWDEHQGKNSRTASEVRPGSGVEVFGVFVNTEGVGTRVLVFHEKCGCGSVITTVDILFLEGNRLRESKGIVLILLRKEIDNQLLVDVVVS